MLAKDGLQNINHTITSYLFKQRAELEVLSKREKQCLFYISRGRTIKEIANLLNLSPKTVEDYWESVRIKLNCDIKSELVDRYIQYTLLSDWQL